jgi:hypothetical protein
MKRRPHLGTVALAAVALYFTVKHREALVATIRRNLR